MSMILSVTVAQRPETSLLCPQPTTIVFGTLLKEPNFIRPLKPQLYPSLTVVQLVLLSARPTTGFSKTGPPKSLHSFFCTHRSLHTAPCVTAPLITPLSRTVFLFFPPMTLTFFSLRKFLSRSNCTPLVISCICFIFCQSTLAVLTKNFLISLRKNSTNQHGLSSTKSVPPEPLHASISALAADHSRRPSDLVARNRAENLLSSSLRHHSTCLPNRMWPSNTQRRQAHIRVPYFPLPGTCPMKLAHSYLTCLSLHH